MSGQSSTNSADDESNSEAEASSGFSAAKLQREASNAADRASTPTPKWTSIFSGLDIDIVTAVLMMKCVSQPLQNFLDMANS
jgi:hypothetical protein